MCLIFKLYFLTFILVLSCAEQGINNKNECFTRGANFFHKIEKGMGFLSLFCYLEDFSYKIALKYFRRSYAQ